MHRLALRTHRRARLGRGDLWSIEFKVDGSLGYPAYHHTAVSWVLSTCEEDVVGVGRHCESAVAHQQLCAAYMLVRKRNIGRSSRRLDMVVGHWVKPFLATVERETGSGIGEMISMAACRKRVE